MDTYSAGAASKDYLAAAADAALIDGHWTPAHHSGEPYCRSGRRGPDRWTPRVHAGRHAQSLAAAADAALIDGHAPVKTWESGNVGM